MIFTQNLERTALNLDRIPQKYSIGRTLTVYGGDYANLNNEGIFSKAYLNQEYDKILFAKRIIEEGNESEIQKLIDSHTGSSNCSRLFPRGSPFVSATLNPEIAQVFATRKNTTIYRLEISPFRAITDYDMYGKFGIGQEILILGLVLPDEIKSVKMRNDRNHSELIERNCQGVKGLDVVKYFPRKDSLTREVKQPENWATT